MPDNLYKHPDSGIWYGRKKIAGRTYRQSLRTRTLTEAKKRLELWVKELERASYYGDARPTWMEAVVHYVTNVLPGAVKPNSGKRYIVSLRQVGPHMEGLYIDQITTKTISGVIRERRREGVTNTTINRDLTAISRVLSACIAEGWRDDNPARYYDRTLTREQRDPIRRPRPQEIQTVLDKCPPMFGKVILFLLATGMRLEEVLTLARSDVRKNGTEFHLLKTKTNRPRVVRSVTPAGDGGVIVRSTPAHLTCPFIFWTEDGDRFHNFSSRFAGYRRQTTAKFRLHDLRHEFAIRWLENGGDIYELSKHLGHSSVKTTEIYLDYIVEGVSQNASQ